MAFHQTCDFCGEEMREHERAATLKIRDRRDDSDGPRGFMMFTIEPSNQPVKLDMCATCLGHLLPISERIRREREATTAPRKATTIETEMLDAIRRAMEKDLKRGRP